MRALKVITKEKAIYAIGEACLASLSKSAFITIVYDGTEKPFVKRDSVQNLIRKFRGLK